jgi:indolepyruvate ferredoxin oxidoreductase
VETQAARVLYPLPEARRPRIVGKCDEKGAPLLPGDRQLQVTEVAFAIAQRLERLGLLDAPLRERVALLRARDSHARSNVPGPAARSPYFCSGCPHNTSTVVPEDSMALGGIGCHTMAGYMDRRTLMPTQMGGEGLNWTGIAPFTNVPHVFQNLGDGTYFHSGILAVRGAVHAGVNVTYKILYNDAVAMTGGQPVDGQLSAGEICRQLLAERVRRVVLVSEDPTRFRGDASVPREVTVHHRDELQAVQRALRATTGVTAIVYEQTCAAEKRRRRKRGEYPDPAQRAFINAAVCEGCGDCSVQANCVSILPRETELGRKREIDQSNCNKDFSCVKGFCPSFITVHGGQLRRVATRTLDATAFDQLPEPASPSPSTGAWNVLVTGIGGTGVVTVGSVLAMAAHLEGKRASVIDMTGLAQKNGAVWSHLRIGTSPDASGEVARSAGEASLHGLIESRVGLAEADLLLGCDLVTAAEKDSVFTLERHRTRAVVNTWLQPTADFQSKPDLRLDLDAELAPLRAALEPARLHTVDATTLARDLLGNTLGANFLLVGYALQVGGLPVSRAAIERAIELNGQAVEFNKRALALGRLCAVDFAAVERMLASRAGATAAARRPGVATLDEFVARRIDDLVDYQDRAYADRYGRLINDVRCVESQRVPGSSRLADAVAKTYFKLLAYKDEYEVARLYTAREFRDELERTFEGKYTLRFHLAPPLLTRPDPRTGEVRKRAYGPWVLPMFRLLARFKFLRGTAFDPFGHLSDRRLERRAIADYEELIGDVLARLDADNHSAAVELASLPLQVRGYGHVKRRQHEAARKREAELLQAFRAPREQRVAA